MPRFCCVPKCLNNNKNKKCFHIPTNKDVQRIWLQRINNSKVPYSSRIDLYVVCEEHFNQDCVRPNGKLIKFSLPTLNLPDYCADPENKDIFFQNHLQANHLIEKNLRMEHRFPLPN
ncbi:uncharacterized protein LOC123307888 [Coccinella septempunctata]|uniref:uncharacterized protein LOC123307888 n=1 Tax=Coccinella septempunctata TaxID=41139 RepID=UPI001D0717C7|nr:uncharacterized protein LOC123307888 [Coccinella septempunctata]